MDLYSYTGPVMEFNKIIDNCWHGETYAKSENKAKINLAYQYKKQTGREARTSIKLPGKIVLINRGI